MVIVTFDVSGMHGCNITAQQDVNVAKLYVVSLYVYVVPVSLHARTLSAHILRLMQYHGFSGQHPVVFA